MTRLGILSDVSPVWILEKHISSRVLPKEEIISWLKWDETLEFDKIIIRSEADVEFHRFLNIDEKVFEQDIKSGRAIIGKELLQIPGFVGFTASYTMIPDDERKLTFIIDFMRENKNLSSVELVTEIIRPKLVILQETQEIVVTPYNATIPPLPFTLQNKGKGLVKTLDAFININTALKNMKIEVKGITERDIKNEIPIFVPNITKMIQKMSIRGMGMGMITLGFEYEDALHNKYSSNLCSIILDIQQKETIEIPITSIIEGNHTLLLEPKLVA